jgi:hypothetical protein
MANFCVYLFLKFNNPVKAKMVENATDYKYSSAMCHAGLVNNSLVTDYDIGVLPSEYQDYLKSMYPFDNEKMNDSREAATVIR